MKENMVQKTDIRKSLALLAITAMIVTFVCALTGCAGSIQNARNDAMSQAVDPSSYMQEDQAAVKELNNEFRAKINKDKSDKAINRDLKQYKKDVKGFATRKTQIREFKKLTREAIKQMDGDQKSKAAQILKDNSKRLNSVKTKEDFLNVTNDINQKIQEATGTSTGIAAATVESVTTAPTKKTQSVAQKTGAKSYSSGLKSTVTARPASSGSSSKSSSKASGSSSGSRSMWDDMNSDVPSTPQKQKVWVQDTAAWTETKYRTETYTYSLYKSYPDGAEFNDYASAYQHYCDMSEQGIACHVGPESRTATRQVPYTVNHPATGHWEYR